jgi:nitrous oxide reductase accessory protein NosL
MTLLPANLLLAGDPIAHPVKGGIAGIKPGKCPNCGMPIPMWARTRHTFKLEGNEYTTCSIRCLTDMTRKAGQPAKDVRVTLYLQPKTLIPADKAIYVIGSNARGTMTMRSKIAFANQDAADAFIKEHGGKSAAFGGALTAATAELTGSYKITENNRLKKGKIIGPGPDNRCAVCGMFPARYPKHHSQILTKDGSTIHFCSTQCLIRFKAAPAEYIKKATKIKAVWVRVYPEGGWEYADGLYYLTGSSVNGPMGPEALPFRRKNNAEKMAKKQGGKVFRFSELTPDIVLNNH